eukprot:6202847-Amphidinium_carterae.1
MGTNNTLPMPDSHNRARNPTSKPTSKTRCFPTHGWDDALEHCVCVVNLKIGLMIQLASRLARSCSPC